MIKAIKHRQAQTKFLYNIVMIQRAWRGYLTRRIFMPIIQERILAIGEVRKLLRPYLRAKVDKIRLRKRKERAAFLLQRYMRGYRVYTD